MHRQRLVAVDDGGIGLEETRADERGSHQARLRIDRRGVLLATETGADPRPSPPTLALPWTRDGWTVRAEVLEGQHVVELFSDDPQAPGAVLTRIPDARRVALGGLVASPNGELAALTWTSEAPGASVAGVEALDLMRGRARVRNLQGLEVHEQGSYDGSRALFALSVQLDPTFPDAQYNLAAALARLGETESALIHLESALNLDGARLRVVAATDEDFESLEENPDFRTLVGPLPDRR